MNIGKYNDNSSILVVFSIIVFRIKTAIKMMVAAFSKLFYNEYKALYSARKLSLSAIGALEIFSISMSAMYP